MLVTRLWKCSEYLSQSCVPPGACGIIRFLSAIFILPLFVSSLPVLVTFVPFVSFAPFVLFVPSHPAAFGSARVSTNQGGICETRRSLASPCVSWIRVLCRSREAKRISRPSINSPSSSEEDKRSQSCNQHHPPLRASQRSDWSGV